MIQLYQAGAGSGKTYTITQEIVRRLADGSVAPDRMLATTFTRKAAAELKDRIQERLLRPEEGDPELPLARRLELAADVQASLIGTVHSVGHQLLSRYALPLGLSPDLEPLEEASQERHLRRILAEMPEDGLRQMERLARRFGIAKYQELVLDVLDQKRANAMPDDAFRQGLSDGIERFIEIISGGEGVDLPDFEAFYDVCRDTATRLEANDDATKTTQAAIEALRKMVRARRAEWESWGKAAKLKVAKKSEGDIADLVALARRANMHARLHADLRAFIACLTDRALELQEHYALYKQRRGLVDFTDLEERLLGLMSNDAIRDDLTLDLVVVDEFQDTNPIQLAIFRTLALAKQSIWVGDQKQAIYGFRGTDPALMAGVMETIAGEHTETLPHNWRSKADLVRVVNQIFEPVFGPGTALDPMRGEGGLAQRWLLQGSNKDKRRLAFVAKMQELLAGTLASDVAVLVRKNDDAKDLAALLEAHGIRALVKTSGLLSTKEGELTLAGLRLVADHRDRLAAATIRHLEADAWFPEAVEDPDAVFASPLIDALRELDRRKLPPSSVVAAVTQALRLADRAAAWGEPVRRLANIDELVRLATTYEEEAEQEGKASTLTGLIFWLENKRAKGDDDLPLPRGVDAVQIMTLWKSKGLEWPTVVLFQDGAPPEAHPFRIHVEGGEASGDPLAGRTLRYWPYPFGITFHGGLGADGSGVQDAAKSSPEGEALIAAQQAETRRLLYVGFTRARDALILAEGNTNSLGLLGTWQDALPEPVLAAEAPEQQTPAAAPLVWFEPARGEASYPTRYHSPSKAAPVPCVATAAPLPGTHPFPKVRDVDWQNLGQAIHAYLAAVPSLAGADEATRVRHARMCLRRWGREGDVEPSHVVRAGERLQEWATAGATWQVEVPVSGPRAEGGTWSGIADLVVVGEGNLIVDHKSADWSQSGWAAKGQEHGGQLRVYKDIIGGRTFIHLPLGGGMIEIS